jgi:DNA polymerase I-like protein with 3'-5' exonuclease and polymerase domains
MNNLSNLGSPEAKIWVINNHIKRGDTGGPMTSSVGKDFISHLLSQGIKFNEIHFDYLVPRIPPPGQLSHGIAYFKSAGIFEGELARLKAMIAEYQPNIVFGLGKDVLNELLGQENINKWRGHVIWSDELQCKMMVTYDPFHAYSQRKVHKEKKPGQYWTLMQADIRKAVQESKMHEIQHDEPELIIAPSAPDCIRELRRMIDEAKIISYDIEVFQPYEGRLMDCIGLCDNTERAICIPFYLQNVDNKVTRYFRNETEYYEIFCLIKQLMESNIPKVAQNSQFDTTMLQKYYGIKVNNLVWDTMVAQHSLYCDLPKDLGTLISLFTNLPYHKYMIHEAGSASRWTYNAADAVANLHVMQGQMREFYEHEGKPIPKLPPTGEIPRDFFELEAVKHYFSIVNPAINSCVYMHIAGVRVDMKFREKVIDIETTLRTQLDDALNAAITQPMHKTAKNKRNFNPLSPQQKSKLFYDHLKCKLQKNGGKVTCDKHAIETFTKDKRHFVATVAQACLEAKAADARLLKFKVNPDNGYIRTQYDVTGTDTGRLASTESDVMQAGTNLQNIAKGPQRQMLIPEDGEEFALVDLYAAEAFLNALDAGEMDMLRMISGLKNPDLPFREDTINGMHFRILDGEPAKKIKIHNWMQRVTYAEYPTQCKEFHYTYKDAKQSIHALNYNVMPDKMSEESGLPIDVSNWQYNMYHTKFPGIKARMGRINRQIRRTQMLITPLGRRRFFIMDIKPELFNIAYAWPSQSTIGEITIIAQNYLHMRSDRHDLGRGVPLVRPVLNTHDGLAIRIKKGTREQAIQEILKAFNIPLALNDCVITIPISIGFAPNFNDMDREDVYFYDLRI